MTFYLTFAILLLGGGDSTVVGKILMKSATANGVSLRAYVADAILPKRTDMLVLELDAGKRDDGKWMALWRIIPQRTPFSLSLYDSEGKPVQQTSEGERLLGELHERKQEFERMLPFGGGVRAYVERFGLSELYILEEGKTYSLRVHTRVKRLGDPYQDLDLKNVLIKVGEIPP